MDREVPWIRDSIDLITTLPMNIIPLKLHMIWVGSSEVSENAMNNFLEWKKMMPNWESKLWRNEDITLEHFPQEAIDKINSAEVGAQKADIMRYYVVEKYGGFYMDTDVIPNRPLDSLVYLGYDLVLYHDNNLTWNYIINCFFGAIPHHPVLQEVCKRILNVELNTNDVHMKTGPYLWGTTVSEVPPISGKKYAILNFPYFSQLYNPIDKFGTHTYAASWTK